LERTGFDEAWNVLQAMQEQDATLADIIRNMRIERGKTGGFDDTQLAEHIEVLGPEVSLEALRHGISTQIIDKIGGSWDEMFGQLLSFKQKHGHLNVPREYVGNPKLGRWVSTNRKAKRKDGNHKGRKLLQPQYFKLGLIEIWPWRKSYNLSFRDRCWHCHRCADCRAKGSDSGKEETAVSSKLQSLALKNCTLLWNKPAFANFPAWLLIAMLG
jgi:hypothetical protein